LKKNALSFLESLDSTYQQHFSISKLSEAKKTYTAQNFLEQNSTVIAALTASQDAVMQALDDISDMEDYIMLHIPQMEDGNNFGVTVQLEALRQLKGSSESLGKALGELFKYYSARADAMDKLKLSSENTSETKKEENDGTDTKTTVTKETKTSGGQQEFHRVEAVYAVDTQYYAIAKVSFRTVKSSYISNLDFVFKNTEKIEKPKGNDGGGSRFTSYY